MKNLYNHDFGCYNSEKTINKIFLKDKKELKNYIKTMLVPILNCAFVENKFMFFKNNEVFKIEIK